MYQLKIGSLPLPKVYVAESVSDARLAREHGLPYIRKSRSMSDEVLVKMVLLHVLEEKFPYIKWRKVLGVQRKRREVVVNVPSREIKIGNGVVKNKEPEHGEGEKIIETVDSAEDERSFNGTYEDGYVERSVDDYIEGMAAYVDIEELQALHMLPSFLGEISDNIKENLQGYLWSEGYTKKLGVPLGNFNTGHEAKNLMILDISGSIPRGVSATMITLIDTLRTQCNCDLIITSDISKWYPVGSELPSPDEIRSKFGLGNESRQFYSIIRDHVVGRTWGNVIAFGDNDWPGFMQWFNEDASYTAIAPIDMGEYYRTKVGEVWSYHTRSKRICGYARWTEGLVPMSRMHFDCSWVKDMKE